MKLYYHPLSTYSQKVVIAFHEKEQGFEPEIVQLFDPESSASYREMYPIGKIPLLMAGEDHMIPESSIIIEYLDGHFDSGARLIPSDPNDARQVRFMDRMIDLYYNDSLTVLLFQGMKPEEERDAELMQKNQRLVDINYQYLDRSLGEHPWVHGSGFSMADCGLMPVLYYAQQVSPFDEFPNIVAYWERAQQRPSWKKNLEELGPAFEAFQAQHG